MFKSILVPVDLSEEAQASAAIKQGGQLAKQHGAQLRFITVLAQVQPSVAAYLPAGTQQRAVDEAAAELRKLAEQSGLGADVSYGVREGAAHHEILTEAENKGVDLIVMTSHKPEVSTYLFGSTAAHVVRHADCSVLVLR